MQGNMRSPRKKRAQVPEYVSPNQLKLEGFESPFDQKLNPTNRWVVLAHLIPWDEICNMYFKFVPKGQTGRPPLNPRIVIGSLIIKHMCNLDDRETVDQISENIYMQYFLGYPSFTNESPFDASLFVEFRKRLGMDNLNAINEKIVALKTQLEGSHKPENRIADSENENEQSNNEQDNISDTEHKGRVIYDATACPQDIAYPTDLNLLNDAREKLEELIDFIYNKELHEIKPRTYREVARKTYLQTAQKKNKSRKVIRKANRCQLNYVRRDIAIVNELLDAYKSNNLKFPLNPIQQNYLFVVKTLYDQQKQMYDTNTHSVEHRIVSIHQPHVRPIVRGKAQAKVEFGSKIHVSIINGISFLDELSWDAFNEGSHMLDYIEKYRKRFGCYPREVLADQIYCTRINRATLKELGIKLLAKPLGRPSAMSIHVSPGERNPIEGKFGQAKTGYGLNRIKARLKGTSESWIATIVLVLNLVKLAGVALLYPILKFYQSFSARLLKSITQNLKSIFKQISFSNQSDNYRQILDIKVG
jgi:transposase, IS5 family